MGNMGISTFLDAFLWFSKTKLGFLTPLWHEIEVDGKSMPDPAAALVAEHRRLDLIGV